VKLSRVMVLNGSPHRDKGSTGKLAAAMVAGMQGAGAEVQTLCAYDLKVSGCLGCFACWTKTPGACCIPDEMASVLALARQAEALVIATPVYVDGMTGQLKMVLDRMIPLVHGAVRFVDGHMRHPQRAETTIRKIALLSTCGFVERDNFDPLITHVKALTKNLGCTYAGSLTVPGGVRSDRLEQLGAAAHQAGEQFIKTGLIPEHLEVAMFGHSAPAGAVAKALSQYFDGPADREEEGQTP